MHFTSSSSIPDAGVTSDMAQMTARLRGFGNKAYPIVKRIWAILNSPLVIALVSGLLIAFIARSYSLRDEAAKELAAQSVQLDAALTELQQRVSYLESADRTWDARCNYLAASKAEWDIINGNGAYLSTTPSYRGINIMVVLTEAQRSSGAWDPNYDAHRWLGTFSIPPTRTAIILRTQLPWLQKYVSNRMLASSLGKLPLRRGEVMTDELKRDLGIPSLAELQRETDKRHEELQIALRKTGSSLPPCKES